MRQLMYNALFLTSLHEYRNKWYIAKNYILLACIQYIN